jgi:hypothetical protein
MRYRIEDKKEIYNIIHEIIDLCEMLEEIQKMNREHRKSRRIRFNPFPIFYIIWNREDIYANYFYGELWWTQDDYNYFAYMFSNYPEEDDNIFL